MNRISIFHYHLKPGGVTNVILLGALSLIRHFPNLQLLRLVCGSIENTDKIKERIEKEIDSTGLVADSVSFEICIEPDIAYLTPEGRLENKAIERLSRILLEKYSGSFWWIHNYQLGKNPLFTAAVIHISKTVPEQKMLLHIHDFPECARFDNLERLTDAGVTNPYPSTAGTSYALINGRDTAILKKAGIPEKKINLLNNPVETEQQGAPILSDSSAEKLKKTFYNHFNTRFPAIDPDAKMLFYPVRTIRRKNALEAGLIAAVSSQPVNLVISLPGTSVQEKAYSDVCEKCYYEGLIPGVWGSGTDTASGLPSYRQMLQLCDLILSSSVQEGFGYLFINSVQLGIPLAARDLDILDGIRNVFPEEYSCFYSSFMVPSNKTETRKIIRMYENKLDSIKKYISASAAERVLKKIGSSGADGLIDFSFLPVEKQVRCLENIKSSSDFRAEVHDLNLSLMTSFYRLLKHGRYKPYEATEAFSLEKHCETLQNIMKKTYAGLTPESEEINVQQNLLDAFAKPEYMRLLYDY